MAPQISVREATGAGKASATCTLLYSSNSQANQNSEASIHCSPAASPQPHNATAKCCNFLQRCSFPVCYLQDAGGESPWKQNVCGWPRQNTFSLGWIYFKIKAQLVMGFYYYYYKYLFKAGYYHYGDFCLVFQHQGLNKRPHTQEGCDLSLMYSPSHPRCFHFENSTQLSYKDLTILIINLLSSHYHF